MAWGEKVQYVNNAAGKKERKKAEGNKFKFFLYLSSPPSEVRH